MHPVLVEIGGFSLYSYGFMISLGIITVLVLLYREAPQKGFDPEQMVEAVMLIAVVGVIGARLLFIFLEWEWFNQDLSRIFQLQAGGLSFYGAFGGGLLAAFLWSYWRKISFLNLTDFFAPYMALGYTFGRMGCFLNGCCYGTVSNVLWALPASMVDTLPRHPIQLYAAAGSLVIFFFIRYLQKYQTFSGFTLLLLIMCYGLLRFTVEFFREGELMWGPLSLAQIFSALLFLIAVIALGILSTKFITRNGNSHEI